MLKCLRWLSGSSKICPSYNLHVRTVIFISHFFPSILQCCPKTDADFSDYMKQIDDISEQADHMEKVCLELDDYTKYLGKYMEFSSVYYLNT
jgi:hypothetical protein